MTHGSDSVGGTVFLCPDCGRIDRRSPAGDAHLPSGRCDQQPQHRGAVDNHGLVDQGCRPGYLRRGLGPSGAVHVAQRRAVGLGPGLCFVRSLLLLAAPLWS
ncbi:hypothetical protein D3C79_727020 [compost metagenome]